jgi:hypothetical protein
MRKEKTRSVKKEESGKLRSKLKVKAEMTI